MELSVGDDLRDGEWVFRKWSDGNEQWHVHGYLIDGYLGATVERIVGPKSRRKNWVVVRRMQNQALYAPKLAGPFRDLDSAKAACRIILSTMV